MADYRWPPAEKRKLIGKRTSRLDGPDKSSGRAKFTYDVNRPGLLYGKMLISPHANAKIVSIDTTAAERMPGVKAIQVIVEAGKTVQWAGQEILALAAETEDQARDAVRAVKVQYELLPHFVKDADPATAKAFNPDRVQEAAEEVEGKPDEGFAKAAVTIEATYGTRVIVHCCPEAHGQVSEWQGDNLTAWVTTQSVVGVAGELARGLNIPANRVRTLTPVMGGGFGSKFSADAWGLACARLAKAAGRPVKLMLERDHEMMAAGARPSMYAKVKVGATRDGELTAWASDCWGTGGIPGGGNPTLPYVIRVPNRRTRNTTVKTNIGPARPWRAPLHPQMCLITMSALDDLAAALNMDPLDVFLKNLQFTERAEVYRAELLKAAELIDWKKKWHPRGDKTPGHIKRGLGLSIHTWAGGGHQSNCNVTIHPDGSVEVAIGSQDLGTGTRTVIGIVAAETFGLPLEAVKVKIGSNEYPPSGASGGSTTVGGVSSSTRRACTNALNELLAKVAASLEATPGQLEAVDGKIQMKDNPAKSLTWKQACARLGATPISATGQRSMDLISSGVGGAQMAEVSVDTETGIVRVEKFVCVQDCGLIINLKTAENQVLGAMTMGIGYALYEEKLMDETTGRCLNPDMEFYKRTGIGDFGEVVCHFMTGPGYDDRGVIGLGEPPVISPGAAISNAVANAIGVRVPQLPITPERVLAALEKSKTPPASAVTKTPTDFAGKGGVT
jgi:xanthine dehydrogenase YagR molybdenum-binding subunit